MHDKNPQRPVVGDVYPTTGGSPTTKAVGDPEASSGQANTKPQGGWVNLHFVVRPLKNSLQI